MPIFFRQLQGLWAKKSVRYEPARKAPPGAALGCEASPEGRNAGKDSASFCSQIGLSPTGCNGNLNRSD
jgi:hypothetical protein